MEIKKILRIQGNRLIVDDSMIRPRQSFNIVIKKPGNKEKQYKFVKTSRGCYILN